MLTSHVTKYWSRPYQRHGRDQMHAQGAATAVRRSSKVFEFQAEGERRRGNYFGFVRVD